MILAPLLMLAHGAALPAAGPAAAGPPSGQPMELAQVIVREQIIIRVPMRMRTDKRPPRATPIEWEESKGPKCVSHRTVAGATLLGQDSVDLILRDGSRVRAKLDNCPALDYYPGFYISPHRDGKICADRDMIRSRMGGECGIERFRALTPKVKD
jgi:hypothetical protein